MKCNIFLVEYELQYDMQLLIDISTRCEFYQDTNIKLCDAFNDVQYTAYIL